MTKPVMIVLAVLMLAPVYFMLTGSLQDIHGIFAMPPRLVPRNLTLDNYRWIFSLPVGRWGLNTLVMTAGGTALSVSMSVMAGYAFAFYNFPLKRVLWIAFLAGLMIPRISIIIPRFVVIRQLGLSGTPWAVVFPAALHPMGIYLSRQFFATVPSSLLESARIDGANEWQILWRVVAPVSRPIVTALALFAAVTQMSDFLWQMLQLQREQAQTLLVGLMRAVMRMGGTEVQINPVGRQLTVGMVLLVPLLLVFMSASRYFTSALGGAIKE